MMIIDGSERIIWPMWIMLSWNCGLGMDQNLATFALNYFAPKSSSAPAISPSNILLIHSIMS
jgi:hypothetical protein